VAPAGGEVTHGPVGPQGVGVGSVPAWLTTERACPAEGFVSIGRNLEIAFGRTPERVQPGRGGGAWRNTAGGSDVNARITPARATAAPGWAGRLLVSSPRRPRARRQAPGDGGIHP